jgi:nucleotide-binding universal stress UspA family protein
MFYRIVVPTDFSDCSQEAWALARRIATAPGSELVLVHVLTEVPLYGEEILALAQDERADLVVIGTRGRGGINRALLGSVADRVVRLAPCPVLTVREPA